MKVVKTINELMDCNQIVLENHASKAYVGKFQSFRLIFLLNYYDDY